MIKILNGGREEFKVLKSDNFKKYISDLNIKHFLVVPFASPLNGVQRIAMSHMLGKDFPCEVEFVDTSSPIEVIQKKFEWADGMYFPGGSQWSLLKAMNESKLYDFLKTLIDSGSIKLLSGGSAGAMVMGPKTIIGTHEVKRVADGFNFVEGYVVDSHFSTRQRLGRLEKVVEDLKYLYKGIGIDENTAVVFDDKNVILDVFGEGDALIVEKDQVTPL